MKSVLMYASKKQAGLTLIELLAALISVFIAFWLAVLVIRGFDSAWRWAGGVAVFLAAYAATYFLLLVGFLRMIGAFCARWDRRRHTDEKTKIDT
jgi:hypothetical protein